MQSAHFKYIAQKKFSSAGAQWRACGGRFVAIVRQVSSRSQTDLFCNGVDIWRCITCAQGAQVVLGNHGTTLIIEHWLLVISYIHLIECLFTMVIFCHCGHLRLLFYHVCCYYCYSSCWISYWCCGCYFLRCSCRSSLGGGVDCCCVVDAGLGRSKLALRVPPSVTRLTVYCCCT